MYGPNLWNGAKADRRPAMKASGRCKPSERGDAGHIGERHGRGKAAYCQSACEGQHRRLLVVLLAGGVAVPFAAAMMHVHDVYEAGSRHRHEHVRVDRVGLQKGGRLVGGEAALPELRKGDGEGPGDVG